MEPNFIAEPGEKLNPNGRGGPGLFWLLSGAIIWLGE